MQRYTDWLRQAERNLKSAEANMQSGIYEEVCYESQQVAEKAIKALLDFYHMEARGHSVTLLLKKLNINVPKEVEDCVQELDKHYIPSRYPDVYDEGAPADYYNERDARECLECGRKVLEWVRGIVRGAV